MKGTDVIHALHFAVAAALAFDGGYDPFGINEPTPGAAAVEAGPSRAAAPSSLDLKPVTAPDSELQHATAQDAIDALLADGRSAALAICLEPADARELALWASMAGKHFAADTEANTGLEPGIYHIVREGTEPALFAKWGSMAEFRSWHRNWVKNRLDASLEKEAALFPVAHVAVAGSGKVKQKLKIKSSAASPFLAPAPVVAAPAAAAPVVQYRTEHVPIVSAPIYGSANGIPVAYGKSKAKLKHSYVVPTPIYHYRSSFKGYGHTPIRSEVAPIGGG